MHRGMDPSAPNMEKKTLPFTASGFLIIQVFSSVLQVTRSRHYLPIDMFVMYSHMSLCSFSLVVLRLIYVPFLGQNVRELHGGPGAERTQDIQDGPVDVRPAAAAAARCSTGKTKRPGPPTNERLDRERTGLRRRAGGCRVRLFFLREACMVREQGENRAKE